MVGFAKLVARVWLISLVCAGSLRAQVTTATPTDSTGRRPRIGLVLSGGSAKGIAHIGVLHVLAAEGIVADVVTGASMGAVIGGLYSIGYSPATLDSIVRGLEWESYFRDAPERRFLSLDQRFTGERTLLDLPLEHGRITLPSGAISGQRISELLSRLTWRVQTQRDFKQFPKPFVAVATDLVTGEAVVLDTGSLAEVMRASMSIPSVFSPVRTNGRLLVDGAITRNLPARDAKALGADLLICSDVADPLFPASELHSLVDVLMQTVTIYMNAANEIERPLCDVYIRPNTAGIGAADFERTREWIDRGITAATEVREQLRAIAARHPTSPASGPGIVEGAALNASHDTVHMSALMIQGVGDAAARTLRRRLRLPDNGTVTAAQLDRAVKRAFATELFDNIRYRLDVRGGDTVVVVDAIVREQDRVGIGLRYDDTWQGSLLFTARLRNRIGFGSTTQFDVRLGEQLRIAAQQASVGLGGTPTVVGATAAYDRIPLAIYDGESHVADVRVEVSAVTAFGGVPLGDASLIGVELKGEYMDARTAVATTSEAERRAFPTASLVFRSNTLDRSAFPTTGHLLALRSELAGGNPSFARYIAHGQVAFPLSRHVSLIGRGVVGAASHDDVLPPHYRFTLGGAFPSALLPETQIDFIGLRSQQQTGAAVTVVGAALQWEARRDVFVTLRSDLGRTGARLTLDRDDYVGGVGASFGVVTPVGPLEVSAGKLLNSARPRIEVSLGRAF